ncbi:MAG: ATP-dependent Clp protease adaptor ClpS [Polyangiales bacterium]
MPGRFEEEDGVVVERRTDLAPKKPRLYKVLMHNDDYTTREFVVFVLETVFHRAEPEAVQIMLHVHHNGVGIAGVYTRDIAETKIEMVERMAREQEYPLRLSMEPEEDED